MLHIQEEAGEHNGVVQLDELAKVLNNFAGLLRFSTTISLCS